MIIVFKKISTLDVFNNPWLYFVYEDSDDRDRYSPVNGFDLFPNTTGIRTSKCCSKKSWCYYTDKEVKENISKIAEDLDFIESYLEQGNLVVFPLAVIGEHLRATAPETHQYLHNRIYNMLAKYKVEQPYENFAAKLFSATDLRGTNKLDKNAFEASLGRLYDHLRGVAVGVDELRAPMLRRLMGDCEVLLKQVKRSHLKVTPFIPKPRDLN